MEYPSSINRFDCLHERPQPEIQTAARLLIDALKTRYADFKNALK